MEQVDLSFSQSEYSVPCNTTKLRSQNVVTIQLPCIDKGATNFFHFQQTRRVPSTPHCHGAWCSNTQVSQLRRFSYRPHHYCTEFETTTPLPENIAITVLIFIYLFVTPKNLRSCDEESCAKNRRTTQRVRFYMVLSWIQFATWLMQSST